MGTGQVLLSKSMAEGIINRNMRLLERFVY